MITKSFSRRTIGGLSLVLIALTLLSVLVYQGLLAHPQSAHADSPQNAWQAVPLVSQSTLNAGFTGGEGGQVIRALGWSQGDPNFLLMTTDVGGVYRSIDGGNHWQSAMVGWNGRGGEAFALDPKNGNRALGVAGNSLDDPSGNKANGLYLTTNKGASWTQVLPEVTGYANDQSVAYDPSSYNATLGYCTVGYYDTVSNGIYKTSDGGTTWSQINSGYSNTRIAVHPTKGYVYLTSDNNPNYGTAPGFYKSTDGGQTFTSKFGNYASGVAVSPSNPDDVWVSRYDWVLASTDAGETFTRTGNTGMPACCSTSFYNITVSPFDATHMSVAWDGANYNTERLYSTDGGKTWAQSDYGHYNSNFRQTTNSLLPYNVREGIWAYSPTTANVSFSTGGDWIAADSIA